MTTSAVTDWAFASALGISGQELHTFLRARGDLRRSSLRGRGIEGALRVAGTLGRWARLYYVPDLCAIVFRAQTSDEVEQATRILLDLLVGEDPLLRQDLESSIRDAAAGIEPGGVLAPLRSAAARWLSTDASAERGDLLDYTDIELYAAPAVVLSLARCAGAAPGATEADPEIDPITRLTANALSGSYGRHAFLLAADLALDRRASPETARVRAGLRSAVSPRSRVRERILMAPDLLARIVRLELESDGNDGKAETTFVRLSMEMVRLDVYRRLFGGAGGEAVGLVFWHDALICRMFELDPQRTATVVGALWLPRIYSRGHENRIEVPLSRVPPELARLLGLAARWSGRGSGRESIVPNPSATIASSGLLLSPWLQPRFRSTREWSAVNLIERCRWLCGTMFDLQVLERLPFNSEVEPFALHLLHSIDVLKRYRNFEGPRGQLWGRADEIGGAGNLGWLARAAWEAALETLGGGARVSRDEITFLLREACDPNFVFFGISPADVDEELVLDLRRTLSAGGLRLIEDALGASPDGSDAGWIGAAGAILALHEPYVRSDGALSDDEVLHGLIARHQRPEERAPPFFDTRILDEISGVGADPGWHSHRRLLLAPVDTFADWVGPGDEKGTPNQTVRLVRAMMRVACALRDTRIDPSLSEQWRRELIEELSRVTETFEFDNFARLQLVRLVAEGAFAGRPEEALAAIAILVAMGRPVQLRRLITAVRRQQLANDPQGETRLGLHQAVSRFLEKNKGLKTNRAFRARAFLLEQLRATCVLSESPGDSGSPNELGERIAGDREGYTVRSRTSSAVLEVSDLGGGRLRARTPASNWVTPGTAQMIAVDHGAAAAVLHQYAPPVPDVCNGFARSGGGRGPKAFLGVVEDSSQDPSGRRLAARFLPTKVVHFDDPRAVPAAAGELVIIDAADPAGHPHQDALPPRRVVSVGEARAAGPTIEVQAEARTDALAVVGAHSGGARILPLTRGTCNFAWLVQAAPQTYSVPAEEQGEGAPPIPKLLDLADLLAAEWTAVANGQILTLALHQVATGAQDFPSIILERRPLEIYEISLDFAVTAESREELLREFENLAAAGRDANGLLISFNVVLTELGPQLQLASAEDQAKSAFYPGLHLPFDRRNLWWRDRFSENEEGHADEGPEDSGQITSVWAQPDGPFLYRCDNAARWNFPTKLVIKVEERHSGVALLNLIPRSWDPWNGTIFGSIEKGFTLRLPERAADRSAAVRDLHGLAPGAVLTLSVTNEIRDDGRVYCRTPVNLTVLVNAESISMRWPCRAVANWPSGRKALLASIRWQPRGAPVPILPEYVPEHASLEGRATGYLIAVPAEVAESAMCKIAWLHPDGTSIVESDIAIETGTRGPKRLRPGSRVQLQLAESAATARILEPIAIANGIWRQEDLPDSGSEPAGSYIGSMVHAGEGVDVYELGGGRFATRSSPYPHPTGRHALKRFFGLSSDRDHKSARDRSLGHPEYSGAGRRCALSIEAEADGPADAGTAAPDAGRIPTDAPLTGVTTDEAVSARVRIASLQLRRQGISVGGGFLLERRLGLLPQSERTVRGAQPQLRPTSVVTRYRLDTEREEAGRFNRQGLRLMLRGLGRRDFPEGIPVRPDRVQRAPFGPDEYYPGVFAKAKIIATDPPEASFLDTAPSTLEELAGAIVAARHDEGSWRLDPAEIRLVFVGRRRRDQSGVDEDEAGYLFEWGYGLWAELPASKLRYRGDRIDLAESILYFGDAIAAARTLESDEGLLLSVEDVMPSRAHELYVHRREQRALNVLNIVRSTDGSASIASIEGFSTAAISALQEFRLPHARLDDETAEVLRKRLASAERQRILARLDHELFETTSGESLQFRRVRLDLQDQLQGIAARERVLLKAGEIIALPNDVALQVLHPGLHPDDVHPSFLGKAKKKQLVPRRNFSLREQTLPEILALDGAYALEGRYLMVLLGGAGGNSVRAGALPRSPVILRELIRRDGAVMAVFGDTAARHGRAAKLRFELLPGVVVDIDASAVDGIGTLVAGDTVRIEAGPDGRLRASLASWSDLSFVVDGRPAVILPRQPLLRPEMMPPYRDEEERWRACSSFSIGDLPALTAVAAEAAGSAGAAAGEKKLAAFMSQRHPKVARLIASPAGRSSAPIAFRFGAGRDLFVGKLQMSCGREGMRGDVQVVRTDDQAARSLDTDWYLLSYRDTSARELEPHIRRARWRFHDDTTITWVLRADGTISARSDYLPPVSPTTGPLFFRYVAGRATLRRTAQELVKFACGPGALLEPLNEAARDGLEAVAAAPVEEGLLIELWPGRVVQLPGSMARHTGRGASVPLRHYAWHTLAAGDTLSMRSGYRDSALSPLELTLTWSQGPRNAFGPAGALLRRMQSVASDADGAAAYGVGRLRVILPSKAPERLPDLAIVGGPAGLAPAESDLRGLINCTVLIVEGAGEQPVIHGLAAVVPLPDDAWDWDDDELMRGVIAYARGKPNFRKSSLLAAVRDAGGALAFTVAGVSTGTRPVVYVSRRHQQIRLREGELLLAEIDAVTAGGTKLLMRTGGRHFAVRGEVLLQGVNPPDLPLALSALAATGSSVWLRQAGGSLTCGHSRSDSDVLTVAPLTVVGRDERFAGVICEGMHGGKLYWIPAREAAACPLSLSQADEAFKAPMMERLQASICRDGSISLLQHPRAAAELSQLAVGVPVMVDPVHPSVSGLTFWESRHVRPDWAHRLVQSKRSSVLFAAAAPVATLGRPAFQAEVAVRQLRDPGVRILLTPAGERLVASDVPPWLLGEGAPPWQDGDGPRHLRLADGLPGAEIIKWLTAGVPANGDIALDATAAVVTAPQTSLLIGLSLAAAGPASGEAAASTVSLLRNLFIRSLAGMPLEWLAAWRLGLLEDITRFTELWRAKMEGLFRSGRLDQARESCRRWLDLIALDPVPAEEAALAEAFALLVGVGDNPMLLVREARFLPRVLSAIRPVYVASKPSPALIRATGNALREIALDLLDAEHDIPLGRAVEFV